METAISVRLDHAVDASGLVPDHAAPVQLDDPPAHRVHDALVVGRHHHRGARPVDAVEQAHDAAVGGVQVAGRLVGQEDQGPVDEGPGDGHPLLLAAGELVGQVLGFLPSPTRSRICGTWIATT